MNKDEITELLARMLYDSGILLSNQNNPETKITLDFGEKVMIQTTINVLQDIIDKYN